VAAEFRGGGALLLLLIVLAGRAAGYVDDDNDLIQNADDNCQARSNPTQADVDLDGFGNACDADCNGDGFVGAPDLAQIGIQFGNDCNANPTLSCTCDFNRDGGVGAADLALLGQFFGKPIGPSALACANATAADDPCRHPLSIIDPFIRTNFGSGTAIDVRVLHNDLADTETLSARLNGQDLAIPVGSVGPNDTSFEIPAGDPKLRDGRNVLSVFVESADPTATLAENTDDFPGRFYLVRHRGIRSTNRVVTRGPRRGISGGDVR
jgi:hypothetical protein